MDVRVSPRQVLPLVAPCPVGAAGNTQNTLDQF